jgi:DEP domain-containing protein 5
MGGTLSGTRGRGRGQYLGRSDMWRLGKQLVGRALYTHKRVRFEGMVTTVKQVYRKASGAGPAHATDAGIVTERTRTIFRSASAKFYLFLQMSAEMWEPSPDGDLYWERAVLGPWPTRRQ